MIERNGINIVDANREKQLAELKVKELVDSNTRDSFERISRSFRNDYHHMNPPVGSIDHQSLAKNNIHDLATIERYVFDCDFDQGRAIPRFRQYWDIDEGDTMTVNVDFT